MSAKMGAGCPGGMVPCRDHRILLERQMRFLKLAAVMAAPALFATCLGLATSAHAVPATPPALLANQQDGVFITDSAGRTYSDQTNLEPGQPGCLLSQCEFFARFGLV